MEKDHPAPWMTPEPFWTLCYRQNLFNPLGNRITICQLPIPKLWSLYELSCSSSYAINIHAARKHVCVCVCVCVCVLWQILVICF